MKWRIERYDEHVYFFFRRLYKVFNHSNHKKIFIDSMTPVDLFQQVKDEAVYLLESNDESSPWSNYSFIGLNPFLYVEEENGTYLAKNKQLQPMLQGDSFKEVFCKIQQELKVKVPDLALPFKGGSRVYQLRRSIAN